MLLKITLNPAQLAALHTTLSGDWNQYILDMERRRENRELIRIKKSENVDERACPKYNVTLEIDEDYSPKGSDSLQPLPLSFLARIFDAIGLFPADRS